VSRCGVLLGREFAAADDLQLSLTETSNAGLISPSNSTRNRSRRSDQSLSLRRAAGQAEGDWFASRRLQRHELRQLTPTRARVERVGTGAAGAPIVQSSVGATLQDLVYLDAANRLWFTRSLAPGQKIELQAATDESAALGLGLTSGWFSALSDAASELAPLDTLTALRWNETRVVVLGPLSEGGAP
jgi:hypothetical protein